MGRMPAPSADCRPPAAASSSASSRSSSSRERRLVCERVYYDTATVLQQLGIARDPDSLTGRLETAASHPLTISRSLLRRVIGR